MIRVNEPSKKSFPRWLLERQAQTRTTASILLHSKLADNVSSGVGNSQADKRELSSEEFPLQASVQMWEIPQKINMVTNSNGQRILSESFYGNFHSELIANIWSQFINSSRTESTFLFFLQRQHPAYYYTSLYTYFYTLYILKFCLVGDTWKNTVPTTEPSILCIMI